MKPKFKSAYLLVVVAWLAIFLSPHLVRCGDLFPSLAGSENFFLPPPAFAATDHIVINEIFTNPAGDDTGKEWVELFNPTSQTLDLTGWQLGAGKYFTLPSFALAPNSFLLIHWRADGQNTTNEIFTGPAAPDTNIGNSSGFVALFNSSDRSKTTLVDYIEYGKAGQTWESSASEIGIWTKGQFIAASDEGLSLGLEQDGQDTNSPGDWQTFSQPTPNLSNASLPNNKPSNSQTSQQNGTTTGNNGTNSTPATPSINNYSDKIFISEFMPYPSEGEEWIELVSQDNKPISLDNWQIGDSASSTQKIPLATILSPAEFLTIKLSRNILNNDGDEVRLYWPDGQLLHAVTYAKALKDWSCAKIENRWVWTQKPTPGTNNVLLTLQTQSAAQNQETVLPLAAALQEQVVNAAATKKIPTPAPEVKSAATVQSPALKAELAAEQSAADQTSNQNATTQPTAEKTSNPTFALAAVALLAALAAFGFVYYRKKVSSKTD